jgi:EpsI family protein
VPPSRRALGFLLMGIAILTLGPVLHTHVVRADQVPRPTMPTVTNCRDLGRWDPEWSPTFVAPDYRVANSFQCDGYNLHINIVQYVGQRQGKEAVGDSNSVIPRNWWNYTTRALRTTDAGFDVDELRVDRPAKRLTIWTWYAVGDRPASSEIGVKTLEAMNAMMLRESTTTNFTVAVEGGADFDATNVLDNDASAVWRNFNETATGVAN